MCCDPLYNFSLTFLLQIMPYIKTTSYPSLKSPETCAGWEEGRMTQAKYKHSNYC